MHRTATSTRVMGLAVTTAMAGALLTGCATSAAPRAELSANRAEAELAGGKSKQAILHAEAAVLAEPRNAGYRAMLANAYLDAGRFASAEATFGDAIAIGDTSPRTALSLALAMMGQGKLQQASALLAQWQDRIAPADLGLAMALAGQPERGVAVMSAAIRGGENNAKIRQNLAYAYALAGRWREARLMASQDLAGDQVGDRMEQWATMAQPDAWETRVAALLQVPSGIRDLGQPMRLALAGNAPVEQLAAAAALSTPVPPAGELPALAAAQITPMVRDASPAPVLAVAEPAAVATLQQAMTVAPASSEAVPSALALQTVPAPEGRRTESFAHAFAEPKAAHSSLAAVSHDSASFAPQSGAKHSARPSANGFARLMPAVEMTESSHLIQLGSFASERGARRAWEIYTGKYPALAGHELVISEAVVRGKHYWRVSAGGYGRSSASSTCGSVHGNGGGCIAWAKSRPLPGAIDTGIRLASR